MLPKKQLKRFALVSVDDKSKVVPLVRALERRNFFIVSTRRTAAFLRRKGTPVIDVEKITNYPPVVGAKGIKIIHPKIFAGVLADRSKKKHLADLEIFGINPFEIVVCNFYPFDKEIAKSKIKHTSAIKNLDIGGPAVVRCAAKNYKNITIVTDPNDYNLIIDQLDKNNKVDLETRQRLSLKAFKYTYWYDSLIVKYLENYFRKNV